MESIVKDLLEELYLLEPHLRNQEKKLEHIVSLMIRNVPKSEMNSEFRKELRKEILVRIQTKKNKYYTFYLPILSGLSLCGVLIFVGINMSNTLFLGSNSLSFAPYIKRVEDAAFGNSIKTIPSEGSQEYAGNTRMPEMTTNKMTGDSSLLHDPIRYTYSYTGKLDFPTGKLTVYKRNSTGFKPVDNLRFINNLRIEGLSADIFDNARISNINIAEDREFGYNISIDFTHGSIHFSQNYDKWQQSRCDSNNCAEPKKLTEDDVPPDTTMIQLTDAFIKKYNIDASIYGKPIVNSDWKVEYMKQKKEGIEAYISESHTVTYPVKIDDQYIYEEYGGHNGLNFTIDIRLNRVSSLTGLDKYSLIASKYNTLNTGAIKKMIQSGGRYITTESGTGKVVNLSLGTPTIGYVRIYGDWKDGASTEYLVPAYIFKIVDKPTDVYVSDTVIVPLVEGFTETMVK